MTITSPTHRALAALSLSALAAVALGACNRPPTPTPTTTTTTRPTVPGPTTTQPGPGPTTTSPTTPNPGPDPARGRQVERLDRGVVSVRSGSGNLVSWRQYGTEAADIGFDVFRDGTKVNAAPITSSTNLLDAGAPAGARYTVKATNESAASGPSTNMPSGYLDIPLSVPGTNYSANDASVGDVDGDGRYEYIVKWDPADSKDNSQAGRTGNVYVDAYRQDGTRLWRIDLGRNIRAGAHYTQFQVYDFDGDGKAEVAMKTGDGTKDGQGKVIGNASADYRNADGYVLTGPEYLTVFNGLSGAAMATTAYVPARGNTADWGDNYGNRVDRFLAGVAYLDGQRPSLVMSRGYYTRSVIVAWDWRNGQLTRRWTFDSNSAGSKWAGQGNHNLSIADIDSDGRDEVVFGAMAVDDNGTGLWSTGYGHGDAQHVGDLVPSRPGLEVFGIQERTGGDAGSRLLDARTGATIWKKASASGQEGPGRGVAADIYPGSPGAEFWSSGAGISGLFDASGRNIGRQPGSTNHLIWWDGDPSRELLDSTHIDKYGTGGDTRLLTGSGVATNNGTKSNPALTADLFGDWREEAVWRTADSRALRIYSTPIVTGTRLFTLMHDTQYRVAVAWQNTAYNQPPHPSFFLGTGMSRPPQPTVYRR